MATSVASVRSVRDRSAPPITRLYPLARVLTRPIDTSTLARRLQSLAFCHAILLATVDGQIASVIADGAYDGEVIYRETVARQHDPPVEVVIPPLSSSVVTTEAECQTIRDRHVQLIAEKGRMAWQKATGYGCRSLVETAIGR